MKRDNYDLNKGIVNTNPRWHTYRLANDHGLSRQHRFYDKYGEIVNWLYASVDNCERHAIWGLDGIDMIVRFRFEKNYLHFMLRWA